MSKIPLYRYYSTVIHFCYNTLLPQILSPLSLIVYVDTAEAPSFWAQLFLIPNLFFFFLSFSVLFLKRFPFNFRFLLLKLNGVVD